MKKILFTLLSLLCGMTAAWAGDGDGTKERPFTGEWQASELGPKLEPGQYLSFDCVILNGSISVTDTKLNNQEVAKNWKNWAPGNLINDPQSGSPYKNYGDDNPSDSRKKQSFILTDVSPSAKTSTSFTITGYFNGFYRGVPEADGFYNVYTAKQMRTVLQAAADAKVRLTEDVYMSDLGEGESGRHTLCSTFKGILDGDGHTIWAARPEIQHDGGGHYHRQYLFTYCDGATIKNVTIKDFRVQSEDNYNQAIITSQAKNGCVFENITLDNVSVFGNKDNVGAVTGYTPENSNCKFTNITVRNSDFTTDGDQSGCVVGHAQKCIFKNITIENSHSTADDEKAGGVVGRADNCTLNDIKILGCLIKTNGYYVGGVAGYSVNSNFTNCATDDQSCVYADGGDFNGFIAHSGGIVGHSEGDQLSDCVNSALVAADRDYAGGIVGYAKKTPITGCLNTGTVLGLDLDYLENYYNRYRQASFAHHECEYNGVKYIIRTLNDDEISDAASISGIGGIVGQIVESDINKCANLGSIYSDIAIIGFNHVGGIGGEVYGGNFSIKDCFNGFTGESNYFKGILGHTDYPVVIENCLSMHPQSLLHQNNSSGNRVEETIEGSGSVENLSITAKNNYMLCTEGQKEGATVISAEELASGKICAKLGAAWGQNLGTDPYPTPTGNKGLYFASELYSEFNSICLPFAVNSDEKVQCYKPQSAGYSEDKAIYYIKLAPVDGLLAGEPGFCRVLEPGSTYTFGKADGESYQFTPQEYAIPVEPSASGDDPAMSWTMSGALQGFITFTDDTNYGNLGRQIGSSEMIIPNAAYIKGPSYFETFTDGNPYDGKPIYIVSSTSPYDVNFDNEVNVADVPAFINQGEDFTPFIYGTNAQNLAKLTNVILENK